METTETFSEYMELINNCDPDDPLLSTTELGKRLDQIPLQCLSQLDIFNLTQALNIEQLIPTNAGLARDYRGIAECMGFSSIDIETKFKRSYNPMKSLIDSYLNKSLYSENIKPFTLNDLLKFIERIERFDVIDDFMPHLIELALKRQFAGRQVALGRNESQSNECSSNDITSTSIEKFGRLTVDDTAQATSYDAFICYAPEDNHYAQELASQLEEHDLRVTTADDLLPGHFQHDALIQLIDQRCRKVVIILTPKFCLSKECEFQMKFASEVGINAGSPKLIPVLYEPCDETKLPSMIRVISKINMTNPESRRWQFFRLVRSLAAEVEIILERGNQRLHSNRSSTLHPAIEVSSLDQNNTQQSVHGLSEVTRDSITYEPVVDLLHSQTSSAIGTGPKIDETRSSNRSLRISSPNPSGNPVNWLRSVKRKVLGQSSSVESISPSVSSRAMLITSSSDEPQEESLLKLESDSSIL